MKSKNRILDQNLKNSLHWLVYLLIRLRNIMGKLLIESNYSMKQGKLKISLKQTVVESYNKFMDLGYQERWKGIRI